MRTIFLAAAAFLTSVSANAADLNCLTCAPDPVVERYQRDLGDHRAAQFFLAPDEPFRRVAPALPRWGETRYAPALSDTDRSRPITDPVEGPGGQLLLPLSNDE